MRVREWRDGGGGGEGVGGRGEEECVCVFFRFVTTLCFLVWLLELMVKVTKMCSQWCVRQHVETVEENQGSCQARVSEKVFCQEF